MTTSTASAAPAAPVAPAPRSRSSPRRPEIHRRHRKLITRPSPAPKAAPRFSRSIARPHRPASRPNGRATRADATVQETVQDKVHARDRKKVHARAASRAVNAGPAARARVAIPARSHSSPPLPLPRRSHLRRHAPPRSAVPRRRRPPVMRPRSLPITRIFRHSCCGRFAPGSDLRGARKRAPFTGRSFSSINLAAIILIIAAKNGQDARYWGHGQ
jgi:hypothetical protein